MDAIAVELAGTESGEVGMPDEVAAFDHFVADGFGAAVFAVEQAEFDALRIFGKKGEVDTLSIPGSAQRVGFAGPNHVH